MKMMQSEMEKVIFKENFYCGHQSVANFNWYQVLDFGRFFLPFPLEIFLIFGEDKWTSFSIVYTLIEKSFSMLYKSEHLVTYHWFCVI